jgi:hypothetical protein
MGKGQQWIALFLGLVVSASTSYFNEKLMVTDRNYILPFIGGNYSWAYFPIFPWLTYPLIGFWFQKTESRIIGFFQEMKVFSIAIIVAVFFLVLTFSGFGIENTIDLSKYYHHTFRFFLWAIGVDILWILLLWFVAKKFAEFPLVVFLRWLGKNITVFYIIQWLIIGNIATEIYQTQELSVYGYWFLPIFLVTVGLTWLVERKKLVSIKSRIIGTQEQ